MWIATKLIQNWNNFAIISNKYVLRKNICPLKGKRKFTIWKLNELNKIAAIIELNKWILK